MSTPPPFPEFVEHPPRRRRQPSKLPYVLAILIPLAIAGVVALFWLGSPQSLVKSEPGRAEVEAWLSENVPSGEWEEVQFWPSREIPKWRTIGARMKYRTEGPAGGPEIHDTIFEIKDGKAIPEPEIIQATGRRMDLWED